MNWWKTLLGKTLSTSNAKHNHSAQSDKSPLDIREGYVNLLHNGNIRRAYGNHERLCDTWLQYQFFSSRDELTHFFDAIKEHARLAPPPRLVEIICGKLSSAHRVVNHYKQPYAILTPYFGDEIQDAAEWYRSAVRNANDISSVGLHADGSEEPNDLLKHLVAVYDWGVLIPEALKNDGATLGAILSDEPSEPNDTFKKWVKLTS